MKFKKNDVVQVITGKYKGQQGRIIKVYPGKDRVIVEGVNIINKHERPSSRKSSRWYHEEGNINTFIKCIVCRK